MKIINNFSSKKHIKDFPIVDTLIWYVGLRNLKHFGHTLKLYCEEKDILWLKEWGLYDFYDEIDSTFLTNNEIINRVDGENFWSVRKIECIHNEFNVSQEPFCYMDVDIIMNVPIELTTDLLVWSPEEKKTSEWLYLPWELLSTPKNYVMPDYIKNCNQAVNCGIIGFKNKKFFESWRKDYLDFVIDNPCEINVSQELKEKEEWKFAAKNIWACNAEQRLLAATCVRYDLNVSCIMMEAGRGISNLGIHYYYLRSGWRMLNSGLIEEDKRQPWINALNNQLSQMLNMLDEKGKEIFLKNELLNNLYSNNEQILKYF